MGAFSSFAIALATICVLSGGITSFPQGLCGAGGAAIGVGWGVGALFALAVALTMAQAASAFPTAGGAYHWATLLGGRAWGWATAWFGIAGLVTAVAAVNLGACRFLLGAAGGPLGLDPAKLSPLVPAAGATLMTGVQAVINHLGIRLTTRLTDFSGYLILVLVAVLTGALLYFGVVLPNNFRPGRLIDFTNHSGAAGGDVWPTTGSVLWVFLLGLLLPAYTLTGFDVSAQTSEETYDAERVVPQGIVRAVLVSGAAGWVVLASLVLAVPDLPEAARAGEQCFFHILGSVVRPGWLRGALYAGLFVTQLLCGLATLTSVSRMLYAFARDGGPPGSRWLCRVSPTWRTPVPAIWAVAAGASACALLPYSAVAAVCAMFLYVSYVLPTGLGLFAHRRRWARFGPWDLKGAYKPLAVLCVLGCSLVFVIGTQPPNDVNVPVTGGFAAALAVIWWGWKRRHFPGPPPAVRQLLHRAERPEGGEA
jgi:amino acid transporter